MKCTHLSMALKVCLILADLFVERFAFADQVNSSVSANSSGTLTTDLCDAALISQHPGDHIHVVKKDSTVETLRYILGSARYNAAYFETVCLTASHGKNSEGKGKSPVAMALTLTPSSVYAEDQSYLRLAKLSLIAILTCDDDEHASETLFEGLFLDRAMTMEWKMNQGETCQLKLIWQETSGELRSWGGTPTSITGFLRAL